MKETSKNNETAQLGIGAVSGSRFQKSFGKSGDNPHWLTKGSRWRPSELS